MEKVINIDALKANRAERKEQRAAKRAERKAKREAAGAKSVDLKVTVGACAASVAAGAAAAVAVMKVLNHSDAPIEMPTTEETTPVIESIEMTEEVVEA